jgi:hypothetical protein
VLCSKPALERPEPPETELGECMELRTLDTQIPCILLPSRYAQLLEGLLQLVHSNVQVLSSLFAG